MIKPVRPSEVAEKELPDFVIHAINGLIAKYYNKVSFTIQQDEIVEEILESNNNNVMFSHNKKIVSEDAWEESRAKLLREQDPIVLAKVQHGWLIVTAWGNEASDEIVVNPKNN